MREKWLEVVSQSVSQSGSQEGRKEGRKKEGRKEGRTGRKVMSWTAAAGFVNLQWNAILAEAERVKEPSRRNGSGKTIARQALIRHPNLH